MGRTEESLALTLRRQRTAKEGTNRRLEGKSGRACFQLHGNWGLTCPAAAAAAAPDPPGVPSGCRSRYSAQSPTLGRRTRAARTSATACRSRFSFRLIGAGQPRRAPPAPLRRPQLRASARPPGGGSSSAKRSDRGAGPAPTPRHFRRSPAGEPGSATASPPRGGGAPPTPPPASLPEPHVPSRPLQCLLPKAVSPGPRLLAALSLPPGGDWPRAARSPPLGPRWCGPLLGGSPARGSFAKVRELASWALTGARCRKRSWGPSKSRPATSAPDSSREFSGSPGDMQMALESGHSTPGSGAVASDSEPRP